MEEAMAREFREQAVFRISESRERIAKCLAQLSDEEIWKRPNPASNSVGNLILHLIGNIAQWIQSGLDGAPDHRVRDAEFRAREGKTGKELAARISETIAEAIATIESRGYREWIRVRPMQGFQFSGIGIVLHVVEHLSYHTGQIAFWTKWLRDKDLGFYRGMDLNARGGE